MDNVTHYNYNQRLNDDLKRKSGEKYVRLPIAEYKNEIIEAVKNNQIVIILGDPGCGKTTQIPQYLYHEDLHENEIIGITQPRRIGAVMMAQRVAKEMKSPIGRIVGYEIRFEKECKMSTKIKYMTDGILFNECIRDRMLNEYRIIMVDEAHERSLNIDLLMGLLKMIAIRRKDLRVIISSATIDPKRFVNYFRNAKVIHVGSSVHPVEIKYHDFCSDYIEKAVELVKDIQRTIQSNDNKGDILIFLTGEKDIDKCCERLKTIPKVVAIPLCSAIDFESQKEVFEPVHPDETKVVVATNIAETSVTIDGVKYVIDCGYVKQSNYKHKLGGEVLEVVRISKAQAKQRTGRAGRTQPGVCHRLYQEQQYDLFQKDTIPEVRRKNLSEIYLKLVALKITHIPFLDSPTAMVIQQSEDDLVDHGLINSSGKLTRLGFDVVRLPIDPILGKVLITSLDHKCAANVICIVALLSEKMQNIFRRPSRMAVDGDLRRHQFDDESGDHFTLLNVYNMWKQQEDRQQWCVDNYIDYIVMEMAEKAIKQMRCLLERHGREIIDEEMSCSKEDIQKCFVMGYFKNICIHQRKDVYKKIFDNQSFCIHGKSSLKSVKPKIILFHEVIKSERSFVCGVMKLSEKFLRDNFKDELELIKFPIDINNVQSF